MEDSGFKKNQVTDFLEEKEKMPCCVCFYNTKAKRLNPETKMSTLLRWFFFNFFKNSSLAVNVFELIQL